MQSCCFRNCDSDEPATLQLEISPPPDAELTPAWAAEQLKEYLVKNPDVPDNQSMSIIATFAFAELYPCESGT